MQTPRPRQQLTDAIVRPSREKSEGRPEKILWLDKNENTDPTYLALIQEVIKNIPPAALFGYPDCFSLYQKLADYLGKDINQLFIAAGSDGVIRAVFEAFVSCGDAVLYTEPTFAMYDLYAKMYGAKAILLQYEPSPQGPFLSAETIIKAIHTEKPKLVCLPNPNSPSGTVFLSSELKNILKAAEMQDAVVLIDEAYFPFYPETVIDWINEYPHLIVARTFSKAWGLAGIRLGFGIGSKEWMRQLHKIRPMYEAGALSIVVAERILSYSNEMHASVKRLNEGKKYFLDQMHYLGFKTLASQGNFFHVAFKDSAQAIHQRLADKVLYRKDFSHPSLKGYSRFTATTGELFLPIVNEIKDTLCHM